MSKQRMVEMLNDAKIAVSEAGLVSGNVNPRDANEHVVDEGTKNLIGQLIMANAIEESGTKMTKSINHVASRI